MPSPHSLVADEKVWATSLLVVAVRSIFCVCVCLCFFFFFFTPQLRCHLRFHNSLQTCLSEGFLLCGNFSSLQLLPQDESPSLSLLSLFFCLLYFFLPPFEDLGCFSGCLMSSASIQKLFCGIYLAFKGSFDEFLGEKEVSHPIPPP